MELNINMLLIYVFLFLQGVDEGPDGLKLISDVIQDTLGITMSVLMGANIANEVADEKFCETTIGESLAMLHVFVLDFLLWHILLP